MKCTSINLKKVAIELMSRFYRRNQQGYYVYPIYNYFEFWLILALAICLISNFILSYISFGILQGIKSLSLLCTLLLGLVELVKLITGSIQNKSLVKYFASLALEGSIRKALLNTMNLNLYKDSPVIQVPSVRVVFHKEQILVEVQKLPGMTDIEKIRQNINSSFTGCFRNFAVIENIEEDNGIKFKFILENVGVNKTFTPRTINDLKQKPYFVKLQNDLVLNLSKYPHIGIWGQTSTGKTTVLMNIIAQNLSNNTDLYFIDGKSEFSSFSAFYPSTKIASDNEEIVSLLKHISETIVKRQKIMAKAVRERKKLGLTGYDVGLKPIVIIADEVGSVVASMSSKEKKELISYLTQIVQKGRSISVFLVMASQSPATTVLPSDIRSQFSTRILLGTATGDVQRMAFDQIATDGGVERFQGYYMTNGLTIQPQKFYVPNLYKNNLATMEVFERLYKERSNA